MVSDAREQEAGGQKGRIGSSTYCKAAKRAETTGRKNQEKAEACSSST